VLGQEGTDTIMGANFVLAECRERAVETWAGRITYRMRLVDGKLRLAATGPAGRPRSVAARAGVADLRGEA